MPLDRLAQKENPLDALRTVVAEHFTETGVIKIGLFDKSTQMSKVFGASHSSSTRRISPQSGVWLTPASRTCAEIPCSAFPRFQHLNHVLGVVTAFLTVHFVREFRLTTPDPASLSSPLPAGAPLPPQVHVGYLLQAEDASWTSRFAQGTRVDLLGSLTLHLMFKDLGGGSAGLRIESLDFDAKAFEESVARGAMEPVPASTMLPAAGAPLTTSIKHEPRSGGPDEADEQQPGAPRGRKASAASMAAAQRGMTTRRRSASAKTEQDADGRAGAGDGEDDRRGDGSADGGDGQQLKEQQKEQEKEQQLQDDVQRQSKQDGEVPSAVVRVPGSPVGGFGITNLGMRCLEVRPALRLAHCASSLYGELTVTLARRLLADRRVGRPTARAHRAVDRVGRRTSPYVLPLSPSVFLSLMGARLVRAPADLTLSLPAECLSTYGDRPRPPPFPPGGPPPPSSQQQPFPHSPMGQPPTPGAAPVAAALQNPSTSSFYSSVAASPGGRPASAAGPGPGQALGQGPAPGDMASPSASAGGGGGKRKAPASSSAQGDGAAGVEGDPGSPQKVARGAAGGRGRGRGR